jgi:hypothetical protein
MVAKLSDWYRGARGRSLVDIHVFSFVGCAVGSLVHGSFPYMLIECPLAVGNAVCSGCGLFCLLLLDLFVGLGLGNDVRQELKVFHASDCVGCGTLAKV